MEAGKNDHRSFMVMKGICPRKVEELKRGSVLEEHTRAVNILKKGHWR